LSKELDKILARLDQLLPPPAPATDWKASVAFRWRWRSAVAPQTGCSQCAILASALRPARHRAQI
jgi:predicted AAA+ superfamily ATPase